MSPSWIVGTDVPCDAGSDYADFCDLEDAWGLGSGWLVLSLLLRLEWDLEDLASYSSLDLCLELWRSLELSGSGSLDSYR